MFIQVIIMIAKQYIEKLLNVSFGTKTIDAAFVVTKKFHVGILKRQII